MAAMFGWLSDGQQLRFALEARETLGVLRERRGQHLDRDVATELRVPRAVHLAHAAGAERRDDLVRPEAQTRGQAQDEGSLLLRTSDRFYPQALTPRRLQPITPLPVERPRARMLEHAAKTYVLGRRVTPSSHRNNLILAYAQMADTARKKLHALVRHSAVDTRKALSSNPSYGICSAANPIMSQQPPPGPVIEDTLIGRYKVVGPLRQSTFRVVCVAYDTLMNRHVLLKVMFAASAADPKVKPRLQREAMCLAAMNHPNVVAFSTSDTTPTAPRTWPLST